MPDVAATAEPAALAPLTPEEVADMEARFPATEFDFQTALDQVRAGRSVKRADRQHRLGCGMTHWLTIEDIAADDWVICG